MSDPRRSPRPLRRPRRSLRRRCGRLALPAAALLSVLVTITSGVGYTVVTSVDREVRRVDPFRTLREEQRPDDGQGANILLIGTDSREGMSGEERRDLHLGHASCYCADAIMLLHLAPGAGRATVVSLPRDSYVQLPAHDDAATGERHEAHPDKLNAALSHGGPALMVRTVEELTRVRVDHYLEVDFASFMRAVDVVGGVAVCTTVPLRDEYSGLDLPAGTSVLDGASALAYVRARHLDGTSDLGRMKRQQRFLAAFLDQAADSEVLLNPVKLGDTARAMLASVRADPGLGPEEMVELGTALRKLSSRNTQFASVPVADVNREVPGLGSTVVWDESAADRLFATLRENGSVTREGKQREKQRAESPEGACA